MPHGRGKLDLAAFLSTTLDIASSSLSTSGLSAALHGGIGIGVGLFFMSPEFSRLVLLGCVRADDRKKKKQKKKKERRRRRKKKEEEEEKPSK